MNSEGHIIWANGAEVIAEEYCGPRKLKMETL